MGGVVKAIFGLPRGVAEIAETGSVGAAGVLLQ